MLSPLMTLVALFCSFCNFSSKVTLQLPQPREKESKCLIKTLSWANLPNFRPVVSKMEQSDKK